MDDDDHRHGGESGVAMKLVGMQGLPIVFIVCGGALFNFTEFAAFGIGMAASAVVFAYSLDLKPGPYAALVLLCTLIAGFAGMAP